MKPYTTKIGTQQFKPSIEELQEMDADNQGFCLACGEVEDNVEPDATRYVCSCCNQPKVYGAGELLLMRLYY